MASLSLYKQKISGEKLYVHNMLHQNPIIDQRLPSAAIKLITDNMYQNLKFTPKLISVNRFYAISKNPISIKIQERRYTKKALTNFSLTYLRINHKETKL